jgi:hypothetical protein
MWLAVATLSAIARFTIVHRAILAGFLTIGLVCRETDCANRGCENQKENFEIIFHSQTSRATIVKASQKNDNLAAAATLQGRGEVCYGYRLPLQM